MTKLKEERVKKDLKCYTRSGFKQIFDLGERRGLTVTISDCRSGGLQFESPLVPINLFFKSFTIDPLFGGDGKQKKGDGKRKDKGDGKRIFDSQDFMWNYSMSTLNLGN